MHVRQQIRSAIITQVTGLTTTALNVFEHRVYPLAEDDLPAIVVSTTSEGSSIATIGGMGTVASLQRNLAISVEGYVKATSDVAQTLDTIAEEIEVALGDDETLGGLVESIELSGTTIEITAEGDQPVGVVKMDYDVVYRTTTGNPSTTL